MVVHHTFSLKTLSRSGMTRFKVFRYDFISTVASLKM